MDNILYRKIEIEELNLELFNKFDRHQDVKKCWRKINGEWVLKDISFVEEWDKSEIEYLVKCLINTILSGGRVYAAFEDNCLVAFSSLENEKFGSKNQYLQLSSIHVSLKSRGKRIGKKLFCIMADEARNRGAEKLYISAHSSEETQIFYKNLGCTEAEEYNKTLADKEPCDCQLEYML